MNNPVLDTRVWLDWSSHSTLHLRAMDISSDPVPAPSQEQPSVLSNWKELTGATLLSQGAEAVRKSACSNFILPYH